MEPLSNKKYSVQFAPGSSRDTIGKARAYWVNIAFPTPLDTIDLGDLMEALCEAKGWEYHGAMEDQLFQRVRPDEFKDATLDESPFSEFRPDPSDTPDA